MLRRGKRMRKLRVRVSRSGFFGGSKVFLENGFDLLDILGYQLETEILKKLKNRKLKNFWKT